MQVLHSVRADAKRLRHHPTLPEGLLWRALRGRKAAGLKFRRQHPIGPFVLDFYCVEIALCVEVDGGSHSLGDRARQDQRRDAWLADKDIRTLRISARLVLGDVDDAVRTIVEAAGRTPVAPPLGELPRSGCGGFLRGHRPGLSSRTV